MMPVPVEFDYEAVTWAGGPLIQPAARDFLDHSLHLRYVLDAMAGLHGRAIEIGCGSGRFIASVAAAPHKSLRASPFAPRESGLTDASGVR